VRYVPPLTTEHPQATRTREFLATFARDDLDALGGFFSDDAFYC
jgi:hypothetical protein